MGNGGVKVILVRHGEATSTMDNADRPLTVIGRRHAEEAAERLVRCGYEVEEIRHSGKLRAGQTAKVIGHRLGVAANRMRKVPGLQALDDPSSMAVEVEAEERSLMLVGHLPFLSRFASVLLTGDPDRLSFRIADAGVVVLGRCRGRWQVESVSGHDTV
ncbi:MAG: phosphohistidine phosphatase SixA [Thermoanaerobaculales bacterium]|jgi:phosphohistidine phosphatase|nr:phosphohistidine phosphatase SixA [Thermoanaerobaculales bacterium]